MELQHEASERSIDAALASEEAASNVAECKSSCRNSDQKTNSQLAVIDELLNS